MIETLAHYMRVLSENYSMNTNMTGFNVFQKSLHHSALKESSLSIGRVNPSIAEVTFVQCTRMQNAKKYGNLPNQIMWVFIGKL